MIGLEVEKIIFNEKNMGEAIDGSLKRLKTDYIDLISITLARKINKLFW